MKGGKIAMGELRIIIGANYVKNSDGDRCLNTAKVRESSGKIVIEPRGSIIASIDLFGVPYITKARDGSQATVRVVKFGKQEYLRADKNETKTDNLGNLPEY